MSDEIDIYEFLQEAELVQFYSGFKNELKVTPALRQTRQWLNRILSSLFQVETVSQVRSVDDDDLELIGMTAKEIEHFKNCFKEHYPQSYYSKLKKVSIGCVVDSGSSRDPWGQSYLRLYNKAHVHVLTSGGLW